MRVAHVKPEAAGAYTAQRSRVSRQPLINSFIRYGKPSAKASLGAASTTTGARGGLRWVETSIVPYQDDAGYTTRYLGVGTDVSRLKALEQALTSRQDSQPKRAGRAAGYDPTGPGCRDELPSAPRV